MANTENKNIIEPYERDYLRELAKKQLETANSEEMNKKEALWYAHNDYRTTTPVVTLERGTFNREFQHLWQPECTTETARNLEYYFHSNMVQHEYINDDTVMPKEFVVTVFCGLKPFDIDLKFEKRINETFAYKIDYEIQDLKADFHKLKKSPLYCNFNESENYKTAVEDIIGDLIPVRLAFVPCVSFAQNIYSIMGLETMMISMYDYPELFHEMMTMLSDDYISLWDMAEQNGYIRPNNFNVGVPQGSYGFTNELPANKNSGGKFMMSDVWGYMDAQETSEISPEMYHEFFFPYYKKISGRFGRFNYGCCEGVSSIWEKSVSKYENLSKVSVSQWCDEEYTGEQLRGKKITYHRKPFPNYLAIDKEFDEKGFAGHIEKTLKAAKGCFLEFSYRDVYSLQGDIYRGKKAYGIIKNCIDKFWEG
ncbi:MAG: hypothetical protein FWH24_03200 [Oscillospiraceae bacterium]|nr:hypothetical protein [Oscillospiraceae bacterium]